MQDAGARNKTHMSLIQGNLKNFQTNKQNREYRTRELKVDLEMGMQRLGIRNSRQTSPTPNRQKDFTHRMCNLLQ